MNTYKYPSENPILIIIFPKDFDENNKKVAIGKVIKNNKIISIPNIDNLDFIIEVTNGIIKINDIEYGVTKKEKSIYIDYQNDETNIESITHESNFQISYLKKEEPK